MTKSIFTGHKGFTLLEMTIVLIIMTTLASAAIPVLTRSFLEKAGEKVSLDIAAIEDASRAYFVTNNSWPASISSLQTANYLPSTWNAVNPFGFSYTTSISGSVFTVSTQVRNGSQIAIINRLPASSSSGTTVSSSIPIPGQSSMATILDYGTSFSSYTLRSQNIWKVAYGRSTGIAGYSSQTVTNLPFTSASSYTALCSQAHHSIYNESPSIEINSGSTMTIYNNHVDNISGNGDCNWIAMGT